MTWQTWSDVQPYPQDAWSGEIPPIPSFAAVANLPVWLVPPNWDNSVTETYQFLTDILDNPIGAEQRNAKRLAPRRMLEAEYLVYDEYRVAMDLSLQRAHESDWLLPMWHEGLNLVESLRPASTTMNVGVGAWPDVMPGTMMLILGNYLTDFELVRIGGYEGNIPGPWTISPNARSWPAGTRVFPLKVARLDTDPQITRTTSTISRAQLRFRLMEPTVVPPAILQNSLNVFEVMAIPPNEREDQTNGYTYLLDKLDQQVALPFEYTTARYGRASLQFRYTLYGVADYYAMLMFLHGVRGSRHPFYVPSWNEDFVLQKPLMRVDGAICVKKCGYTQYGFDQGTSTYIAIFFVGKPPVYRRVIASRAEESVEWLTLDSTLDKDYQIEEIRKICLLVLVRLDQDQIEIEHITDVNGVADVVLTFKETFENRNQQAASNDGPWPIRDVAEWPQPDRLWDTNLMPAMFPNP
jgi:hypothetical protein